MPLPARAQFYDLDGAYHCLTTSDASCKQASNPMKPAQRPSPATPTVEEVIARIRTNKVSLTDIEVLEKRTAAHEPRAVEALAWCKLNGIGVAADPVAAYFLYAEAAQLGIPTAKANQQAIFETRLDSAQRNAVLMREQTQ